MVHNPYGVAGQEGAPSGGDRTFVFLPGHHIPADRTGSVLHPKLRLEFQRDPILPPAGIIGRDSANQTEVAAGNPGSSRSTGSSSPVAMEPLPMPLEDRCRLDVNASTARALSATDSSAGKARSRGLGLPVGGTALAVLAETRRVADGGWRSQPTERGGIEPCH
jgi:hypothetical protein